MLWDALFYLPSVLTKVDRASMACSLEVRAPLLDYELFEYGLGLPDSMKVRGGQGKYLLRQVLKRYVPQEMFERPKQGFNIPLQDWLCGDLQIWAEDLLSDNALSHGLLDGEALRSQWAALQDGRCSSVSKLWRALMFQQWYKQWG